MTAEIEELAEKVLALPTDERRVLLEHVQESLGEFSSAEIEKAWLDLAEKRWKEIESGKVKPLASFEVIQKARDALGQ